MCFTNRYILCRVKVKWLLHISLTNRILGSVFKKFAAASEPIFCSANDFVSNNFPPPANLSLQTVFAFCQLSCFPSKKYHYIVGYQMIPFLYWMACHCKKNKDLFGYVFTGRHWLYLWSVNRYFKRVCH